MHPILAKTLGGLSRAYYFRHFIFGLALFALFVVVPLAGKDGSAMPFSSLVFFLLCTVLYPYSRFVYEGIASFIMGNTVIAMPLPVMLIWKVMSMALCWAGAIFIAPVGLAYLYWHHSKQPR